MIAPTWNSLVKDIKVEAASNSLWQKAFDWIAGPILLRFNAQGTWRYTSAPSMRPCTADGDLLSPIDSSRCIWTKAPVGALLGRIGGSTADKETNSIFVIGSYCVVAVDKNKEGPLFLTINDLWNGLSDNSEALLVDIDWATDPSPPAAA